MDVLSVKRGVVITCGNRNDRLLFHVVARHPETWWRGEVRHQQVVPVPLAAII